MLSEVMAYYGLTREFHHAGYFETIQHQQMVTELKTAIAQGKLVALSGIVGCGKTTMLQHIQELLAHEQDILVSKSLAIDKDRVNLGTLIMTRSLSTARDFDTKMSCSCASRATCLTPQSAGGPLAGVAFVYPNANP